MFLYERPSQHISLSLFSQAKISTLHASGTHFGAVIYGLIIHKKSKLKGCKAFLFICKSLLHQNPDGRLMKRKAQHTRPGKHCLDYQRGAITGLPERISRNFYAIWARPPTNNGLSPVAVSFPNMLLTLVQVANTDNEHTFVTRP